MQLLNVPIGNDNAKILIAINDDGVLINLIAISSEKTKMIVVTVKLSVKQNITAYEKIFCGFPLLASSTDTCRFVQMKILPPANTAER
ncbi:hypothetical protein FACS1894132_02010 [Clostridia bacterium]|nr:hypothetical protein FACS1894132_02010 [Clostridia bacterium]